MQSDPGPISDAVYRYGDFIPLRASYPPEVRVQVVACPLPQHVVVESIGIVIARLSHQVMCHIGRYPRMQEAHCEYPAMEGLVAIEIGAALPGYDGLE